MALKVQHIPTTPYPDQKPGTSGLRKKVSVFKEEHYTENFVQAILTAGLGEKVKGSVLVVGGDGRYYMQQAIQVIIQVAAANGVSKLLVGQRGILSTPAASCVVRKHGADGAILLTASHNLGGPEADFGIKFNTANGGPAPEAVTDAIYEVSKTLSQLTICPELHCDVDIQAVHNFKIEGQGQFEVHVVDPLKDYVELMRKIFDFKALKEMFKSKPPIKIRLDSMHGVTGPYVKRIFVEELGAPASSVVHTEVLEDFGGQHPDPNLTYAADLVREMAAGDYAFGAAFDGDGDRNMILGQNAFFVTPSDSLAVLANNIRCIPQFANSAVNGFARSMPTASAVDRVAKEKDIPCYEVPTGWKYFGNLMDAGCLSLCGEESFGTGSSHIREKDGVWAALAWLQVMAVRKKSVMALLIEHWHLYGRHFFTRYDYEDCAAEEGNKVMDHLQAFIVDENTEGRCFEKKYTIATADNFSYTDPIDGSITENQGVRIIFTNGSRMIFRQSGTGSSGATIRIYIERYENDSTRFRLQPKDALKSLIHIALEISKLREATGRQTPTVIT